jgi:hypothetical protein
VLFSILFTRVLSFIKLESLERDFQGATFFKSSSNFGTKLTGKVSCTIFFIFHFNKSGVVIVLSLTNEFISLTF